MSNPNHGSGQYGYHPNPYPAPPPAPTGPPAVGPYGYGWPPQNPPSQGFAVASMVLGILSLLSGWVFGISIVLGILAVVFAVKGNRRSRQHIGQPNGMATAGLVTGILGIIFGAAWWAIVVAVALTS